MSLSVLNEICDGVYCINLIERKDRYEATSKLFDKYNLKVEWHKVNRHPEGGRKGCFTSHMEVIRKAKAEGKKRILILEDDIKVEDNNLYLLDQVKDFVTKEHFRIFYLACIPIVMKESTPTSYKNIFKCSALSTQSYILSESAIDELCQVPYLGCPIDTFYSIMDNCYAVMPVILNQGDFGSDVELQTTPGWAKSAAFRVTSWYARNIGVPIYFLLIALTVLIIGMLICYFYNPMQRGIWLAIVFMIVFFTALFTIGKVKNLINKKIKTDSKDFSSN